MSKIDRMIKQIETLPDDRVKAVVLSWLTASDGSFEVFEKKLADERDDWAEIENDSELDTTVGFPNLTEEEMQQEDMKRWEEYCRTGHSIPQHKVAEWLASIGTERELPCPE
ncbi:MAG: hypothetical protein SW833_25415 [Cyanobacteriota bacterium]|nr:hypothetical protein [Cyanobacteriota bacterium]